MASKDEDRLVVVLKEWEVLSPNLTNLKTLFRTMPQVAEERARRLIWVVRSLETFSHKIPSGLTDREQELAGITLLQAKKKLTFIPPEFLEQLA